MEANEVSLISGGEILMIILHRSWPPSRTWTHITQNLINKRNFVNLLQIEREKNENPQKPATKQNCKTRWIKKHSILAMIHRTSGTEGVKRGKVLIQ